jgi:fatty acid-binding protein DegV
MFITVNVTISNNEKQINYDDLFNKIKEEIKNKMTYITNKENIKTAISDISNSGTKIIIKVPISSENYMQAKGLSAKIVREVIIANNILLLDNNYIDLQKSAPNSPQ